MNQEISKLKEREAEQAASRQEQKAEGERQFGSVEELLRCDSEQNPVPPEVAERVSESIAREPKPARSWWRKWLSGGD